MADETGKAGRAGGQAADGVSRRAGGKGAGIGTGRRCARRARWGESTDAGRAWAVEESDTWRCWAILMMIVVVKISIVIFIILMVTKKKILARRDERARSDAGTAERR